jgi:hypothetical protein
MTTIIVGDATLSASDDNRNGDTITLGDCARRPPFVCCADRITPATGGRWLRGLRGGSPISCARQRWKMK